MTKRKKAYQITAYEYSHKFEDGRNLSAVMLDAKNGSKIGNPIFISGADGSPIAVYIGGTKFIPEAAEKVR